MEIGELLATAGLLSSAASALTEYFKSIFATLLDRLDESVRVPLIQTIAVLASVGAAAFASFDLLHIVFPDSQAPVWAGVILTGLAMALPADGLRVLLEFVKAARDQRQATATSSVEVKSSSAHAADGTAAPEATVIVSSNPPTHG